ncbi:hypothetical protein OQX61_23260 [Pedobacter sp. PLR]|uniref:hypothetical protein n=1 Tax=Pedobacter sp. PLR TaxID=2994465 RepID=UPI0022463A24|nr:hypothetical protein [Pedobacter sp. PLR]MCX2454209.1 hypothetical protein [Pedobacter sp. PLR]
MSDFKPHPVLEYTVNLIEKTISGAKIQYTSTSIATLKDGNDTIYFEQKSDSTGNAATIFIKDPKEIIYSEDLMTPLNNLHENVKGELKVALQSTTIIINALDVATNLIFQAVKDEFDQLSNSYEFVKTIEKEITKVKSKFKFGKHLFDLTVTNEPTQVLVTPEFPAPFDTVVKKTIEEDVLKVQTAMCIAFKNG